MFCFEQMLLNDTVRVAYAVYAKYEGPKASSKKFLIQLKMWMLAEDWLTDLKRLISLFTVA